MSAGTGQRSDVGSHDAGLARGALSGYPPLDDALVGLSLLTVDPLRLEEVLVGVARLCQQAVPGAEGTGLRLLKGAPPDTVVGSTGLAGELDTIQHRLAEGPCVTARADARTVRCDSVSAQDLWPRFRRAVRHLDVQSVLSLPLLLADQILGSISVHARGPRAFTDQALAAAERFSCSAAPTVRNAQLIASAQRKSASWGTVDATRHVIDQALGIMISRTGGSPSQAFEGLLVMSQQAHRPLSAVAAQIVDDAARGVRTQPSGHVWM